MHKKLLLTCLVTGALAFGNHLRAQTPTPPSPFVEILATDPTALDGTSSGSFTLIREGDTNADLTVNIELFGTASNGVDYVPIASAIVIPTGYLAVDIPVQPVSGLGNPGNKTVILTIDTNADYRIGRADSALVTIVDDVFNNPPPTVLITDPTNGSTFAYPAGITLTADATDAGTDIQSVSFYADDEFLGRVTNAPYTITWPNARPGRYTIFARAVDDFSQSSVSPMVQITVTDVLPTVTITAPADGAKIPAHQAIPITAGVTDANPNVTIASVAFFENGRFLASVTKPPYQFVWSSAPAGSYSLQAAATDSNGQTSYSTGVEITVSRP